MRNSWVLAALLLAGCSTHPIVDMMDFLQPGKMYRDDVTPYGGVCNTQGAILAPTQPFCPPVPPVAPGPGVVPPPVPLPGNSNSQSDVTEKTSNRVPYASKTSAFMSSNLCL